MKPLISVLMPMYNAAAHLAEAIESICRQTWRDWELLCLDDGSTDQSAEIIVRLRKHDGRIRLIQLSHGGIVAALNQGFRLAQGEFIARMDADDVALPHRFELQMAAMAARPEVAVLGGAFHTIDTAGQLVKTQSPPQHAREIRAALARSNCMCHPSVIMRRQMLAEIAGPYREPFLLAEDYDLWLRVTERFEVANLADVVLLYRRDLGCVNPQRLAVQTVSTLAARHCAKLRRAGLPDPADGWTTADEATLLADGASRESIARAVRRVLLAEARLARRRGHRQAAVALWRHAAEYAPRGAGAAAQLDYLWRRVRARVA